MPDKCRTATSAAASAVSAAAAEEGEATPSLLPSVNCPSDYITLCQPWGADILLPTPPAAAQGDAPPRQVVTLRGSEHATMVGAVEILPAQGSPSASDVESQPLLLREAPPCYTAVHYQHHTPPNALASGATPNKWQPTITAKDRPQKTNWCGILLAFLSGACFTLSSAAVKALRSIDPMELLLIRSLLQVLTMLPLVIWGGGNGHLVGPRGYRLLLQLQGFVGGMTLVLLFFSFRRLPLGDATTIIFSSPVLVMVLSFIFLREPCGFFRTFIVFLLVTGVVLIAKPPFLFEGTREQYDVIGYTCAISATIFTALNIVVMRKCKDIHFSVVVLQLSVWSLIMSAGVLLIFGHRQDIGALIHRAWDEWGLAVAVSILGLTGQVLVAQALHLEGAGKVSVTRSLDIVLAFILQVFAFGDLPDWESILGAMMVLFCVVGIGLEEHVYYIAGILP